MSKETTIVDARGLSCPQPVLITKQSLSKEDNIKVLLDSPTAKDNVAKFAKSQDYKVDIENNEEEYTIHIYK
ncbi:sulfurtransferase TusA family protein [Natranaerobius trueperi]|uniref:UPF0033 domain-containing protein n=1 Tax=Natranaerobius trueperi TaxID=759412 RepID=A0A226C3M9_9FIRM|nr:sulfurtransferase TusA family protein [Natranaerobius trueperi]OWZ85020.1 hypothetical protein CDO51_01065 [Natranaerobius trueperi]